jgi:hypothetical protein
MHKLDSTLLTWAKKHAEQIYQHLETKVNPNHNWRQEDISEVVTGAIAWPSEWSSEPYLEELPHVLNDYAEEFGVPIPPVLIAYHLSLWTGGRVPPTHPLVQNAKQWREIALKMEFDDATAEETLGLIKLAHSIAKGETAENLPTIEDITAHHEAPTLEGRLFTVNAGESIIYLLVGEDSFAAMNDEGQTVVMDFNGNRLHSGANLARIQEYITQGMKFSRPITDKGELASLVGNDPADMLLGTGGLSIFDLPDPNEF